MSQLLSRRSVLSSLPGALLAGVLPGLPGCGSAPKAVNSPSSPGGLQLSAGSPFPADFAWGVATSAYQIEGAASEDGRGPSIWDRFSKQPGATFEGQTGEVACDHYHRYREDVELMRTLGARAYRFSISWSRVLPEGRGQVNEQGLDFYSRLVDELAHAGITPYATLFHWDYPSTLFDKGGWLERDSADWFAEYASVVVRRLGDRVTRWITLNEPNVVITLGHVRGIHAPGLKLAPEQAIVATHHLLRAHGKAVQAIRAAARPASHPEVGVAFAFAGNYPASSSQEDLAAAQEHTFASDERALFAPSWWLDPMLRGSYPADGLSRWGKALPANFERDLAEIHQPQEFLGLNVYWSDPVRRGADGRPEEVKHPPGYPRAANDWQPITPQALYYAPLFAHGRYQLPIYIMENGLAVRDRLFLDGAVHDPLRSDYLQRALMRLADALREGVPVRGYFHWSLLDNFEWSDGFKQRFGLVYVDFSSQRRLPKDSFAFYRDVISSNGARALAPTAVAADVVSP
jgi:beta-glucosidase